MEDTVTDNWLKSVLESAGLPEKSQNGRQCYRQSVKESPSRSKQGEERDGGGWRRREVDVGAGVQVGGIGRGSRLGRVIAAALNWYPSGYPGARLA